MGVTYRLKPEVKEFIIAVKKSDHNLSCRKMTALILDKFQIKLSKSSINALIKASGLSMPVGRRLKKRRRKHGSEVKLIEFKPRIFPEIETKAAFEPAPDEAGPKKCLGAQMEMPSETQCAGAVLLKAADYLLGGSHLMAEAINNRLSIPIPEILTKTEALLYQPLLGPLEKTTEKILSSYLDALQGIGALSQDIAKIFPEIFQERLCIKMLLSDGSNFYLDARFHTVWSTPHIPYDFSATLYSLKRYINEYFRENTPLVFSMAPGYDMPTKEFFDFLLSMECKEKKISEIAFYSNRFEELEIFRIGRDRRSFFIFGLWPWQFGHFRSVKLKSEFKAFFFGPLRNESYIAEAEVVLMQPNVDKKVILKGCALKTSINEKTKLIILTNLDIEEISLEELARTYLARWPNLQEGFEDFSRKIELFTYMASSRRFFSPERPSPEIEQDIKALFNYYLMALDQYVRWHFLPFEAEGLDLPTMNARFYSLKGRLKKENNYTLVSFQPGQGFSFANDLEYACRRINEREAYDSDGTRIWLNPHLRI
jgi:hypothetical protein